MIPPEPKDSYHTRSQMGKLASAYSSVLMPGTRRIRETSRTRWAGSDRMPSGFTTCTETSSNGVSTVTAPTRRGPRTTRSARPQRPECGGAGVRGGKHPACGRRTVSTPRPACGTSLWAFGSPESRPTRARRTIEEAANRAAADGIVRDVSPARPGHSTSWSRPPFDLEHGCWDCTISIALTLTKLFSTPAAHCGGGDGHLARVTVLAEG
jgi:hypothetical protein